LDVILGCGWQEEQEVVIDWDLKILQPKDGMKVPFYRMEKGEKMVGCVIPEAREEMRLYPAEEVCIPGRAVKCVGFEARGAWKGEEGEKKVGYVRGLVHRKNYMLAEGLAVVEDGMVWAAVANPYPTPVYLDPKSWAGMMTLCNEQELDSIWVRQTKGGNLFDLGGGRKARIGGVNGVMKEREEAREEGNREEEWSEDELAGDEEDEEADDYERMRWQELEGLLQSAEGISLGSEKPCDALELGGHSQSEAFMEGLVGRVMGCVGKSMERKGGGEWNRKGLDKSFRKDFGFVLDEFDLVGTTLGRKSLTRLLQLLVEFRDVWECDKSKPIKRTTRTEHSINLKEGSLPFKDRNRQTVFVDDQITHKHLKEMSLRGVIRPSSSPWASAVQLVDKKDGKVRFCVDYRKLNALTIKDSYPLPRIDDILNKMGGARFYTTMDLSTAFWSIPIREEDRAKTAFTTKFGLWEWCSMPFGLTNAPATQQRFMEAILSGFTWEFCMVYVDDIVVWSGTEGEHIDRLRKVFERIREGEVFLAPSKCSFAKASFDVLGHLCTQNGVGPNPKKVKAVVDYPVPKNRPALRRFLGLAGWVSRFIRNYSKKTRGMRRLLTGEGLFEMGEEEIEEFEAIKKDMISPPVLVYPDYTKPFHIHVDSSAKGMGAVLTQKNSNGKHMVIAYASAATTKAMLCIAGQSASVLECLGVVWAVHRFREYVHGQEFWLYTDHAALVYTLQKPSRSKTLDRLAAALMECNMHVMHIPGNSMKAADAISRAEYDQHDMLNHEKEPLYMGLLELRIALPGGVEEEEEEERADRKEGVDNEDEEDVKDGGVEEESLLGEHRGVEGLLRRGTKGKVKAVLLVEREGEKVVMTIGREREKKGSRVIGGVRMRGGEQSGLGWGMRVMMMTRRAARRIEDEMQDEEDLNDVAESLFQERKKEAARVGDLAERRDAIDEDWVGDKNEEGDVMSDVEGERESEDEVLRGESDEEMELISDDEVLRGEIVGEGKEDDETVVDREEESGAEMLGYLLEGEGMAAEQKKDPWLSILMTRINTSVLPEEKELRDRVQAVEYKYAIGGKGILRRVDVACLGTVDSPVVVPTHLVDLLLLYMHEDPLAGHLGINKTYSRMRERFYFQGMYTRVREHVRTCISCQRNKDGRVEIPPAGVDFSLQGFPGITLQLDYTVAQKTIRGNSHVLNIIDRFTRFSKFYATGDPDGEGTAVLLMDYIATFGCPVRIISDNGTEFNNSLIKALAKMLGVSAVTVSAYNPRANGQVERPWRTLKEMMRAYVTKKQDNWDVLLPLFQLAMNTATNETTGYAPYFLMMGRRAVLPVEAHWGVVQEIGKDPGDYVRELKENMRWVFELVRGKVEEAQRTNMLNRMGKEEVRDTVKVGDLVLIKSAVKKKGLNGKLLSKFSRMVYRVVEKIDPFRVKLVNIATKAPLSGYVNVCRIKKFFTKKIPELEGEDEYVVSRIRGEREVEGVKEFLVEWEGYTDMRSTWEKGVDINAPALMKAWERSIMDGLIVHDCILPERKKGVKLGKRVPLMEGGDGRRRRGEPRK
jgi:hypothetical protein